MTDIVSFLRGRLDEQEREFSAGHEPRECHPNCGHVCALRGVEAKHILIEDYEAARKQHNRIAKIAGKTKDVSDMQHAWHWYEIKLARLRVLRVIAGEWVYHPEFQKDWIV